MKAIATATPPPLKGYTYPLKVTCHSKQICMVSPISTRLFLVNNIYISTPSLRLFRFKMCLFLHIFDRFCGFLLQKGTN